MNNTQPTNNTQPAPAPEHDAAHTSWFDRALSTPSEAGDVDVAGVSIHYVAWGERGRPGIVLIHGSNAHLEWWRFVAPFLADQFRVVALDSSGNGDSGWRDQYTGAVLAEEVWAVCQAAELGPHPVIVGHSFGGFVALETAYQHDADIAGLILVDFTVSAPQDYTEWGRRAEREGVVKHRTTRVYEDRSVALGRFRLLPDQPTRHPAVLRHIAEQSLRPVDGGWTWKFDPSLFDHLEMGADQHGKFLSLTCPSAVVLGEHSEDGGAFGGPYMASLTDGLLPVFAIPTTHHHLMFDEPMAVVAAIKGIALSWRQMAGRRDHDGAIATARGRG